MIKPGLFWTSRILDGIGKISHVLSIIVHQNFLKTCIKNTHLVEQWKHLLGMPFLPSSHACLQQFSLHQLSPQIFVTKTDHQMALEVRSRRKRNHIYKHTLLKYRAKHAKCINIYRLLQQIHHYIFAISGISVCRIVYTLNFI